MANAYQTVRASVGSWRPPTSRTGNATSPRGRVDGPLFGQRTRTRAVLEEMLPSLAALRVDRGEVIGEGDWVPIISPDEHRWLVALLTAPSRRVTSRGPEPRHLLSGNVLECGRCGGRKWSYYAGKRSPVPLNRCAGCHLSRRAADLDAIIDAAMVSLLEDPRTRVLLTDDDLNTAAALEKRQALQQRVEALRAEYVDGRVSAASFAAIEAELTRRIDDVDAAIAAASRRPLWSVVSGAETWAELPIVVRKEAVRMALRIVVNEQAPMLRGVDPESIGLEWRV